MAVDVALRCPYIPATTMQRILLAFLALIGVIAQTAPAQAAMCRAGTEIGAVTVARAPSNALAVPSAKAILPDTRTAARTSPCLDLPASKRPPVYIPSVQLQADRAHE